MAPASRNEIQTADPAIAPASPRGEDVGADHRADAEEGRAANFQPFVFWSAGDGRDRGASPGADADAAAVGRESARVTTWATTTPTMISAAAKTPGPLRAFYQRVCSRRGMQIAVVATARKLAVLCWTMIERGEDYAFARPSLTDKKLRALELRAGMPSRRGQKGKAAAYSLKEVRRRERELAEQGERARTAPAASLDCLTPSRRLARTWSSSHTCGTTRHCRSLKPASSCCSSFAETIMPTRSLSDSTPPGISSRGLRLAWSP